MRILKAVCQFVALALVVTVLVAAALYWIFDYNIRLDGSGVPRVVREAKPDDVAARVESHRAVQGRGPEDPRLQAIAPASAPGPAPVSEASGAPTSETTPAPARDKTPARTGHAKAARTIAVRVAPYWTGFRGPLRDGVYRQQPVLTAWPAAGLQPLWKQPIGGGYASFAVAGGRAFTIEQRRAQEVVTAYDVDTGREVWAHGWDADFKEWMGGDGPRATPTWADGQVYALGATGELRVLDAATGTPAWRINILDDNAAENLPWGMAASPLVVDDLVIVLPGGPAGRSVVAYDRRTGARRWSALNDKQAYSAPMLATIAGHRQMLVITSRRLVALTTENGELLWEYPWPTANDINASQPVILPPGNRVLLSSGYGHGAAVIEVTHEGGRFGTRLVWEHGRLKNRFSSSVVHDGFIYGLDESILTCVNAGTGEVAWKGGRYGHGQFVLASGHLVLLTEDGALVLVRATPERHDEVARFAVLEGKTWNHPALDDGRLLVRNLAQMAAFDLRLPRSGTTP
jgi:outer membrane protein assembly factor BamB